MEIAKRYWPAKNPQELWSNVEVVAAASHPGAANSILPIVDRIASQKGAEIVLFTAGKINEEKNIVPSFPFTEQPAVSVASSVRFLSKARRLVLSGVSSFPDVELELSVMDKALEGIAENIPTDIVLVEDNVGGLRSVIHALHKRGIASGRISRLFLASGSAARSYPEEEFGIPRERMKTTGSATFDAIKTEDTASVNQETRNALGIALETIVIGYFGMPSQERHFEGMEFRSTATVGRAVSQLAQLHPENNFAFLYRRHPREAQPEKLRQLLPSSTENLRVISHEDSQHIPTSRIAASSDIGVSLGSTVLTEMALRGTTRDNTGTTLKTGSLPLYLLNADMVSILGHPDYRYEMPITVQLGAAAVAWNNDQLLPMMKKALFDPEFREAVADMQATALKDEYAFDPATSAADLAVLEIENSLSERR